MELHALLLTPNTDIPAIIVRGDGLQACTMMAAVSALGKTPGLGKFTCCERNHRIDGRAIKCDKEVSAD